MFVKYNVIFRRRPYSKNWYRKVVRLASSAHGRQHCLRSKFSSSSGSQRVIIETRWSHSRVDLDHERRSLGLSPIGTRFPREIREVRVERVELLAATHLRIWSYPAVRWIFVAPGSRGLQPETQSANTRSILRRWGGGVSFTAIVLRRVSQPIFRGKLAAPVLEKVNTSPGGLPREIRHVPGGEGTPRRSPAPAATRPWSCCRVASWSRISAAVFKQRN